MGQPRKNQWIQFWTCTRLPEYCEEHSNRYECRGSQSIVQDCASWAPQSCDSVSFLILAQYPSLGSGPSAYVRCSVALQYCVHLLWWSKHWWLVEGCQAEDEIRTDLKGYPGGWTEIALPGSHPIIHWLHSLWPEWTPQCWTSFDVLSIHLPLSQKAPISLAHAWITAW